MLMLYYFIRNNYTILSKLTKPNIFLRKYLVVSKKCSNFASSKVRYN